MLRIASARSSIVPATGPSVRWTKNGAAYRHVDVSTKSARPGSDLIIGSRGCGAEHGACEKTPPLRE
eukprot:11272156-Alexandrium_andersonii.AAC.1